MGSKVVRTDFGSGLICPRGSKILRAEIQRALRRGPRQLPGLRLGLQTRRGSNHSTAHVGESNSRSNVFRSVVHLFACPAVEKFCRASSAGGRLNLRSNIEQPDRVGRRGLSEPGGIFSRLITYAFPWLCQSHFNLRIQPLKNSAGRVPQAAD